MIFIEKLDNLLDKLNPDKFHRVFKNYLYYIKAMIYYKHKEYIEAKNILEDFFSTVNEEEIYKTYEDINDLYLNIIILNEEKMVLETHKYQ